MTGRQPRWEFKDTHNDVNLEHIAATAILTCNSKISELSKSSLLMVFLDKPPELSIIYRAKQVAMQAQEI